MVDNLFQVTIWSSISIIYGFIAEIFKHCKSSKKVEQKHNSWVSKTYMEVETKVNVKISNKCSECQCLE